MKSIHNDRAKDVYPRLREALVDNNMFDEVDALDKSFLNDVLGALLVTGPIDEDDPFTVERAEGVETNNLSGRDFEVHAAKVSPYSGMYEVHFVAAEEEDQLVYEFNGRVRNSEPALVVEKAQVRPFSGRLEVPFEDSP